ncbi:MAG: hypothetical protein ACYDH1_04610 [Anaerolineaceae bacterium]|jgi:ElaB/YqjD/DUF883 family membrane-anchored ribosome-binding protein|nr:MAG: hypothetical protein CVU46_08090 [Chloroflexi bacterium HGW-Chloroflexi-8]
MSKKTIETRTKEDLETLKDDVAAGMKEFGDKVNQTAENVKKYNTSFMEDGAARFSRKFEGLKSDAIEKANDTVKTIGKDVNHGLDQYNKKVQDLADSMPGDFIKNSSRYPWVAISLILVAGFTLGFLLKPTRQSL